MKTNLFILLCLLIAGKIVHAQSTYTMPVTGTQTDTVCGGFFYDSGGPTLNYSNSGNGIMIFCPAVAGQFVMMQFTSISLADGGDRLRIFSGSDTTTVPLFNVAGPTSSAGCGTVIVSTDSSGCLTVHFISNSTMNAAGWRVILYCVPATIALPPGTNCANPVSIPSIPFSDNGCTECMLNDYQGQAGICNATYAGEDRVYQYTATLTESVCIRMYNTSGNPTLAVYQGCPGSGGTCVTPVPMIGNDSMQVTFPGAGTYYIIIDETSGYSCYDLSITPPCIVGIEEQGNPEDGILIFPNPVINELRIQSRVLGRELKIKEVEIFNLLEESIFRSQVSNRNSQISINVGSLTRGIYFINITDEENNSVNRKIVKM